MSTCWLRIREHFINFYPPLLGAGIRVRKVDELTIHVEMKLTAFNRNIVGTNFGGSFYAMCDPWFMLILMRALGTDYVVWHKAANIQFSRPGRSTVTAIFHIPQERVNEILRQADSGHKIEPIFAVDVLDMQGQFVAHVENNAPRP